MRLALFAIGTIVTIDRIEGPYAVLEWGDVGVTEIPITALPSGAQEGDRIVLRARTLPRSSVARHSGRRPRGAARARGQRTDCAGHVPGNQGV
ncbi:MAG: DUF3006 domain-containing protein [Pseudomonadota bacterium]|nr:DUF3006 domain-containing protein [Pseudomonadota bacterium]